MNRGRVSTSVLLSFLIIMFLMVMGCGKRNATSVISGTVTFGDVRARGCNNQLNRRCNRFYNDRFGRNLQF